MSFFHGLVMIFSFGSTLYLLSILADPISRDTGWSLAAIMGALSAAFFVAGLFSPLCGKLINKHDGRLILSIGCITIALGLLTIGLSKHIFTFWLGWILIGGGMSASLYDAAFASLGKLYGDKARTGIGLVTLLGGLASTVCWPLSSFILEISGWRNVVFTYACIHLIIIVPIIYLFIPYSKKTEITIQDKANFKISLTKREKSVFWNLAVIQFFHGFIVISIATWLFIFLQAQGISFSTAVMFGTLIGPAQIAARLVEMTLGSRFHPIWTMTISVLTMALGIFLITFQLHLTGLGLILYAGGNGIYFIAKGTYPLLIFPKAKYAALMGQLALPWMIAQSIAPLLGAWTIRTYGPQVTLFLILLLAVLNLLLVIPLFRSTKNVRNQV